MFVLHPHRRPQRFRELDAQCCAVCVVQVVDEIGEVGAGCEGGAGD